jgi:hypothetical protein
MPHQSGHQAHVSLFSFWVGGDALPPTGGIRHPHLTAIGKLCGDALPATGASGTEPEAKIRAFFVTPSPCLQAFSTCRQPAMFSG